MNTQIMVEKLKSFADLFRLGRPLEVTDDLIILLEEIITETAAQTSNTVHTIEEMFSLILHCQESEDWLGLADYLEYELSDFLICLSGDKSRC